MCCTLHHSVCQISIDFHAYLFQRRSSEISKELMFCGFWTGKARLLLLSARNQNDPMAKALGLPLNSSTVALGLFSLPDFISDNVSAPEDAGSCWSSWTQSRHSINWDHSSVIRVLWSNSSFLETYIFVYIPDCYTKKTTFHFSCLSVPGDPEIQQLLEKNFSEQVIRDENAFLRLTKWTKLHMKFTKWQMQVALKAENSRMNIVGGTHMEEGFNTENFTHIGIQTTELTADVCPKQRCVRVTQESDLRLLWIFLYIGGDAF